VEKKRKKGRLDVSGRGDAALSRFTWHPVFTLNLRLTNFTDNHY
jgi:hypothetical protein